VGNPPGHQEPARVLARRRTLPLRGLSRSFLILHGLEGSGPDHWQTWLAGRLRERGERVSYPDLPGPFDPDPEQWLAALRDELAAMDGERIVLCHSLACLLWLLHARAGAADAADRVLLVAPPCAWDVPAVARFRADGVKAEDVERAAGSTSMFCGAPDPYCPGSAIRVYGGVLPRADCVPGAGHVNPDAGYGPWPAVEQWAMGEREDVGPN
jgi:predicted alpha/beta hydrolase family esterase